MEVNPLFNHSFYMRKVNNGENTVKTGSGGRGNKLMMEIVATNVFASRLPEQRPTATLLARAKITFDIR